MFWLTIFTLKKIQSENVNVNSYLLARQRLVTALCKETENRVCNRQFVLHLCKCG